MLGFSSHLTCCSARKLGLGMAKHKTMRVAARHKVHLSAQCGVTPVSSYIAGGWTLRSGVLVKSRTLKTTLKSRKRPCNEADPRSAKVILYAYNIYYVK